MRAQRVSRPPWGGRPCWGGCAVLADVPLSGGRSFSSKRSLHFHHLSLDPQQELGTIRVLNSGQMGVRWYFIGGLNLHFPVTNEIENLFMCLCTAGVSSFAFYLFVSFYWFLNFYCVIYDTCK